MKIILIMCINVIMKMKIIIILIILNDNVIMKY